MPLCDASTEIFRCLADEFNGMGYSVSRITLPRWALYAASLVNTDAAQGYKNSLVAAPRCSHDVLSKVLGLSASDLHTDVAALVLATAYSCIAHGVVEDKSPGKALSSRPDGWPGAAAWGSAAIVSGLPHAMPLERR
jgi:hypothetical protein